MAYGKPLNNKSFYGGNETGRTPDIAMPPLDHTPAIAQQAPDPWQQQQQVQQPSSPFGPVPNELPQEVREEMSRTEQDYDSNVDDQPIEAQESSQAAQINQSTHQQEQPKDASASWKEMRAARERAEQERDAMLQQMLMMQQNMQQMKQQQPQKEEPQEQYDFEDIDSESLVEGKHVKKVAAKIRNMEQQLKRYQAMTEETAIEAKIRAQFPDFEKVVSRENIEMLNTQFPEIAQTLRDTPDMFNKAAAAYSVIKNFGIHKDTPKYEEDRAKAIANAQKPRPLASVNPTQGDSPLSKANAFANGMTDELKEQLRKEMFAARKAM